MRRFAAATLAFVGLMLSSLVGQDSHHDKDTSRTTTPIKHVVVIFDENNSFDHYFGKYPQATNPPGEPVFVARHDTPSINGLTPGLINNNPNPTRPFRLDRSMAVTCDNDNHYKDEQTAYDGGLLDKFALLSAAGAGCTPGLNMGYYDGNTVTALWKYAQHFAMSDNFFATEFGTTVMGHLNLVSGQTHGATPASIPGRVINGTVIANVNPVGDDCGGGASVQMAGASVGDLLSNKGVTWGWFYGDWTPTGSNGPTVTCSAEYDAHYAPFQYFASTLNPHHLPPSSVQAIGHDDQAKHQYAITDFWDAVAAGNMPSVVFLKPPHVQNGHPSDSNPLAEQEFLVDTINRLQETREWKDMAILITYDDSDGWYDHVMPPIVSQSNDPQNDALLGPTGLCGVAAHGSFGPTAFQDRCGYGPRLPFLVISPFAKENYVDHSLADQSSLLRFIEDNWQTGQIGNQSFDALAGSILGSFDFAEDRDHDRARDRRLFLDPNTGDTL
jgi:phospholipase C